MTVWHFDRHASTKIKSRRLRPPQRCVCSPIITSDHSGTAGLPLQRRAENELTLRINVARNSARRCFFDNRRTAIWQNRQMLHQAILTLDGDISLAAPARIRSLKSAGNRPPSSPQRRRMNESVDHIIAFVHLFPRPTSGRTQRLGDTDLPPASAAGRKLASNVFHGKLGAQNVARQAVTAASKSGKARSIRLQGTLGQTWTSTP